ncbi:MAG: Dabb family protein [Prevotellaceae bacterium]|jgi:hypothetical protein|nr:Dabb family protein [Prevotellaceae bacterium]
MNKVLLVLSVALLGLAACSNAPERQSQKLLKHVVLFDFNDDLSDEQVREIETAFVNMPAQIEAIKTFEWGTDIQTEKTATHPFTHCFVFGFESEEGLKTYVDHPAHKKVGEMVKDKLKTVSFVDYWENGK